MSAYLVKYLVSAAALIALAGPAGPGAQGTLPAHVRAAADTIRAADLARDLAFLSSDELRGRNTPSPGFDAAAAYISDRLRKAGVKPAGDDGTYFQHYTMREATVDTSASHLEIRGRRLAFGDDFVMRSFASPVGGTFRAVYVGHGWTVPTRGVDPYAGLDVRGKVLIAHGPRALPKDVEIAQIGRVTPGASSVLAEAHARGAVAVVFLPQEGSTTNWDQMRGQNTRRRELDPAVPSAYAAAPVTSVLLSRASAEALMAGEPGAASLFARAEARDYPASFELGAPIALTLPAATDIAHRPYNVAGIVEGSDPELRHEYITVFAHLDGAVGSREIDGDAIYNAADDNATGSAAMLAIAERWAAAKAKRSVIFVWDSGEEQGLWGTRHFVANPPVPLDRIVAHINIDMIGATRAPGTADAHEADVTGPNEVFVIGPGVLSHGASALLDRANAAYLNMTFNRRFDTADAEFFYPRTDAGPFLERGILPIGFFTGIHRRYHLPADEAQFLDPAKMEAVARTVYAGLWMLADTAERPSIERPIPAAVPRHGAGCGAPRFQPALEAIRNVLADEGLPSVAVAVAEGGRITCEAAFGLADVERRIPATPSTMYSLASISKPFTATALMRMVEEGAVDLDRPANDYLGDGRLRAHQGRAEDATPRRLLTHTAGLPLHYQFFYQGGPQVPSMDAAIGRYGILVYPPGERYFYANLGYGVLEQIVARAGGAPYAAVLGRTVIGPLALTETMVSDGVGAGGSRAALRYNSDGTVVPPYTFDHVGASGVWSSARDLARFGAFHLGHDRDAGPGAVSRETRRAMQQAHAPSDGPGRARGLGWAINESVDGHRQVSHTGSMPGVATMLSLYPEADVAVVVLTNVTNPPAVARMEQALRRVVLPRASAADTAPAPVAGRQAGSAVAATLGGLWSGEVHLPEGSTRIALEILSDGDVRLRVGDGEPVPVEGARLSGNWLTARTAAAFGAPDAAPEAARTAVRTQLTLAHRGDRLSGWATSLSTATPTYGAVSFAVELRKAPSR